MREAITLSFSKDLAKTIKKIAKKKGLSVSGLVKEAIQKYLLLEEFETLRAKTLAETEPKYGVLTDEDVFKIVS